QPRRAGCGRDADSSPNGSSRLRFPFRSSSLLPRTAGFRHLARETIPNTFRTRAHRYAFVHRARRSLSLHVPKNDPAYSRPAPDRAVMIRKLVDFALQNRFLVLAAALVLFAWGAISFHQLPVEAYPDVANNYVEIIMHWPGIAAEQIEQQVTISLETAMNGVPGVAHLRSFSIFGLSDLKLIFDDNTSNFENRERALERLTQVSLPTGVTPQMG